MNCTILANGYVYNHKESFEKHGHIDWIMKANYQVGDMVYIYRTRLFQKIMYKVFGQKNQFNFLG